METFEIKTEPNGDLLIFGNHIFACFNASKLSVLIHYNHCIERMNNCFTIVPALQRILEIAKTLTFNKL